MLSELEYLRTHRKVPNGHTPATASGEDTVNGGIKSYRLHLPWLLRQNHLRDREIGDQTLLRDPPELDILILRPRHQETVVKRGKREVGDHVAVSVHAGYRGRATGGREG